MSLLERRAAVLHRIWHNGPLEAAALRDLVPDEASIEFVDHLVSLGRAGLIEMDAEPIDPLFGPSMAAGADELARRIYGELLGVPMCRVCGCSDHWACEEGCCWVEADLCSSCADAEVEA